jgi:hypothetical protein
MQEGQQGANFEFDERNKNSPDDQLLTDPVRRVIKQGFQLL